MHKSEQYINYTYIFVLSSSQNQLSIKLSADIHNGQQFTLFSAQWMLSSGSANLLLCK
jgi:hypothetical protein